MTVCGHAVGMVAANASVHSAKSVGNRQFLVQMVGAATTKEPEKSISLAFLEAGRPPSSELFCHLYCYQRLTHTQKLATASRIHVSRPTYRIELRRCKKVISGIKMYYRNSYTCCAAVKLSLPYLNKSCLSMESPTIISYQVYL